MSAGELQQMLDEMAARLGGEISVKLSFRALSPAERRYAPPAAVTISLMQRDRNGEYRHLSNEVGFLDLERAAHGPIARLRTEIEKLAIRFRRLLETTEAA